jgi:hypothetical protein
MFVNVAIGRALYQNYAHLYSNQLGSGAPFAFSWSKIVFCFEVKQKGLFPLFHFKAKQHILEVNEKKSKGNTTKQSENK